MFSAWKQEERTVRTEPDPAVILASMPNRSACREAPGIGEFLTVLVLVVFGAWGLVALVQVISGGLLMKELALAVRMAAPFRKYPELLVVALPMTVLPFRIGRQWWWVNLQLRVWEVGICWALGFVVTGGPLWWATYLHPELAFRSGRIDFLPQGWAFLVLGLFVPVQVGTALVLSRYTGR